MPVRTIIDPDYSNQIGTRLKFVRESLNLTRSEVAESIFVTPQSIGNLERGAHASKALCHHLMLVYYDYFYNYRHDQAVVPQDSIADIESDLEYVENYLYDEED